MVERTQRWNPWAALRARPHLRLAFAYLDDCTALIEDDGRGRLVVLDARLDRRERRVALGHELIHDERSFLYDDGTPDAIIAKEEAAVDRILATRLVPPAELDEYVARCATIEQSVVATEVADEFDVTVEVADLALWLKACRLPDL